MSKKGIIITIVVVVLLIGLLGNCVGDSEYESAGKEFNSWVKNDPNSWTDTQKDYFNDLMDWADKN